MEHELETTSIGQLASSKANPIAAGLENHGEDTRSQSLSTSIVAEPEELHPSSSAHPLSRTGAGRVTTSLIGNSVASPQPVVARSASTQSNQTLTFNTDRSMSDLINNAAGNGVLEHGPAGGYRDRMRPSISQHYRAGRYRSALEGFMSRQRMYISIVTFLVMFGMTIAGLWLEIAGSHQALA